jgi:hypothetical protein
MVKQGLGCIILCKGFMDTWPYGPYNKAYAQNSRPQWTETTSGFGLFSFLCAALSGSRLLVGWVALWRWIERIKHKSGRARSPRTKRQESTARVTAMHGYGTAFARVNRRCGGSARTTRGSSTIRAKGAMGFTSFQPKGGIHFFHVSSI